MSFSVDPVFECIGNAPYGTDDPDPHPEGYQITLLPPGEHLQMTWVLGTTDMALVQQFEVGKKYALSLTVKEVSDA